MPSGAGHLLSFDTRERQEEGGITMGTEIVGETPEGDMAYVAPAIEDIFSVEAILGGSGGGTDAIASSLTGS